MNDDLGSGEAIEWYLREEMVFRLILHSSHHQQPEDILLPVISAADDLVVDIWDIWLLSEGLLPLVVANQHKGRVKP